MEVYEVKAVLSADWKSFQEGLKGAMASINEFKSSAMDMTSIGSTLKGVGAGLTLGVTAPLVGIGAASIKAGSSFEAGMSKVQAISGASSADMEKLSAVAKEMGATTKFSATESAEALSYMGMAGWKADQMVEGLPAVMNLAAASGEELGMVSDIVTDSLSAFGLQAKDAGQFADILAAAATNSNTNVGLMGETFKYVAPIAGALGYNAEDTAVAVGLMANAGIKGSQAGTTLRTALTRLAAPTKEVESGMKMLGLSVEDVQGLSLDETLATFRNAFQNLDGTQQAQAASLIFGKNAMSGMLSVINASEEEYNSLSDAIYNSSGTAEKMSKIMQDNLSGSFTIMKSALEGVGIAISETLIPIIKKIVDKITEWAEAFNKLSPEQQATIVKIGLLVASIGPLLMIVGTVIGKFKDMVGTVQLVAKGFGKLIGLFAANPWLLLVAGIAVAAVAIYKHWDEIKAFMSKTWQAIKDGASNIWNGITEKVGSVVDGIKEKWGGFKDKMSETWTNIKEDAATAWDNIKTTVSDKATAIKDGAKEKIDGLKEQIGTTWDNIKTAAGTSWDNIKTTVTDKASAIKDGAKEKISGLKEQLSSDWEGMKSNAKTSWDNIKTSVVDTTNSIKSKTQEIWTAVKADVKEKWDGISSQVKTSVNNMKTNTSSGFTDMVSKVKSSMAQLVSAVKQGFTDSINAAKGFISQAVSVGKDLITGFVKGVTQFASKLISAVKNAVGNAISAAKRLLGIGSPSRVFRQIGGFTMEGFAIGIDKESKSAVNSMKNVVDDIIGTYEPMNNIPQLDSLKSKAASQIDYQINDNLSQKQPATINLKLGNRNFRAVVDDITNMQGKIANFEEVYSW
ncbi:phage tail tape measure protein [Peptoniphilus catoniae]|uniref:phage tail tape measure protein n=1 Tax=Peptoniphilus catoniae TaxID=1660341 RepID=UPI0010FDE895|nr:phage tail tape measure protein [Peptoniphilus catoniae]